MPHSHRFHARLWRDGRGMYGYGLGCWHVFSRQGKVTAFELIDHSHGKRVTTFPYHAVRSHDFPRSFSRLDTMLRAIDRFEAARGNLTDHDAIATWWENKPSADELLQMAMPTRKSKTDHHVHA